MRTIDEGSMDEGSGMNFSEYVAVLSGNTDLLEKARLEKKIAALESERQSFVRNKSSSRYRLEGLRTEMGRYKELSERIEKDLAAFKSRVEFNEDGSYKNRISLDSVQTNDPQLIGKTLNQIVKSAVTGEGPQKIGSIYGFDIVVKSERTMKEDFEMLHNRIYVRGEGGYLYQYNYGNLAGDPRTAAMNPINALGTIESILEKMKKDYAECIKDIPQLEAIINSSWRKEAELNALKTEMEGLDRRIQLSLKPISEETETGTDNEIEVDPEQQQMPATEENHTLNNIPNRLQQIAAASEGHIVIASMPRYDTNKIPGKKMKL